MKCVAHNVEAKQIFPDQTIVKFTYKKVNELEMSLFFYLLGMSFATKEKSKNYKDDVQLGNHCNWKKASSASQEAIGDIDRQSTL